jgi:lysine-N-methylase
MTNTQLTEGGISLDMKYALMPGYMKQFSCIGAECEDTCCAWWGISIDKATHDKYLNISDRTMRDRLSSNMTIKKNGTQRDYAEMNLNRENGNCGMLESGRCSIHAQLGEEYLSSTCATYPRIINDLNNSQEVSAQISCPEVARLVLLNPKGIEFFQEDELIAENLQSKRKVTLHTSENSIEPYFWEIRIAAIAILQNRDFNFPHRLIILGLLCENINQLIQEKTYSNIPIAIEAFKQEINHNAEIRNYDTFPSDTAFQFHYLHNILAGKANEFLWNLRYKECLNQFIHGMEKADSINQNEIVDHFNYSYKKLYQPYMDEHAYIMENFAVNYVYSTLFPLANNGDIFTTYTIFVIHYALIKLHLIGMAAHHEGLTHDLVVKLIQSYTKNYEHSNAFMNSIYEDLRKSRYITMGHMSLFIKN